MKQRKLEDFLAKEDIPKLLFLMNKASELMIDIQNVKLPEKEDEKRDYEFKETLFHIYEIWPEASKSYTIMYDCIKKNKSYDNNTIDDKK
jgi:hypothetical protein